MKGLFLTGAVLAYVATGDWLASVSVLTLGAVYLLLKDVQGPPVLFLALSYQWMQTSIGLFYGPFTGRPMLATTAAEWGTMVLIGLGCVLSLAVGIRVGINFIKTRMHEEPIEEMLFSMSTLLMIYFGAFIATGILQSIAYEYPMLREPMAMSSTVRLMVFYFAVRRLLRPSIQVLPLVALLGFEVLIGLTGFFANFKEPMLMTAIALLEVFDRRRATHWLGLAVLVVAATTAGVFWMGVRGTLRTDFEDTERVAAGGRAARFARLREVGSEWWALDKQETLWTIDFLVERQWVIYYPALAIARVPSIIPHTGGELIWKALVHVATPRLLYPNKPGVGSDSDLVRRVLGRLGGGRGNRYEHRVRLCRGVLCRLRLAVHVRAGAHLGLLCRRVLPGLASPDSPRAGSDPPARGRLLDRLVSVRTLLASNDRHVRHDGDLPGRRRVLDRSVAPAAPIQAAGPTKLATVGRQPARAVAGLIASPADPSSARGADRFVIPIAA